MLNTKIAYWILSSSLAVSVTSALTPTLYAIIGIRLYSQPPLSFHILYMIPQVAVVILLYGLFFGVNWKDFQRPGGRTPLKPFKPYPSKNKTASVSRTYDLQKKLFERLQGDRAAAHRLVNNLKVKNPGKPEEWYWQRAIEQLERDRY